MGRCKMTKTDGKFYLLTQIRVEYGVKRITIRVMRREKDHVLNCTWSDYSDLPAIGAMADLELMSYFGDSGIPYGLELQYGNVFSVNEKRASVMSATLRKVGKALAAEQTRDCGDLYMAFGKAVGAVGYVRFGNERGSRYQDADCQFGTLAEGRYDLRRRLEQERDQAAKAA